MFWASITVLWYVGIRLSVQNRMFADIYRNVICPVGVAASSFALTSVRRRVSCFSVARNVSISVLSVVDTVGGTPSGMPVSTGVCASKSLPAGSTVFVGFNKYRPHVNGKTGSWAGPLVPVVISFMESVLYTEISELKP